MIPESNPVLSPEDFLSGPDLANMQRLQPGAQLAPQQVAPGEPITGDPAFYKEPQFVNADKRLEIDAQAQEIVTRERLAEERVQSEVDAIKNKYTAAPQHPKEILRDLLMKGELRKTYSLFGHKWTFRALDQGDLLLAVDDLKDSIQTEAGRLTAVIFSKVVYSIEEIDDVPVYRLFPDIQPNHYPSKIEYIVAIKRALRAYLVGMPPVVIDELFFKYQEVEKERDSALEKLKNS